MTKALSKESLKVLLDNEKGLGLLTDKGYPVLLNLIEKDFKKLEELYAEVYKLAEESLNKDEDIVEYLENCEISINGHKKDLTEISDYVANTIDFLCLEIYCSKTFKEIIKMNGFDNNE